MITGGNISCWWLLIPTVMMGVLIGMLWLLRGRRLGYLATVSCLSICVVGTVWKLSYQWEMGLGLYGYRTRPTCIDDRRFWVDINAGMVCVAYSAYLDRLDGWEQRAQMYKEHRPILQWSWDPYLAGRRSFAPFDNKWKGAVPWWANCVDVFFLPELPVPPPGSVTRSWGLSLGFRIWLLFFPLALFPTLWFFRKLRARELARRRGFPVGDAAKSAPAAPTPPGA